MAKRYLISRVGDTRGLADKKPVGFLPFNPPKKTKGFWVFKKKVEIVLKISLFFISRYLYKK